MARLARLVVPGLPHHVTQRGNRRQLTFFEEADYVYYLELISGAAKKSGSEIWCYCLMPNHVHFVVVPSDVDGLRKLFADAHRRYTGYINARLKVTGHLWQGRFGSVVMDEEHLANAVRYVSRNPVRAKLTEKAQDWKWSSVQAHLNGESDGVVTVKPVQERYGDFAHFVDLVPDAKCDYAPLRSSETSGRPLGSDDWIKELERRSKRSLLPQKRGPKARI